MADAMTVTAKKNQTDKHSEAAVGRPGWYADTRARFEAELSSHLKLLESSFSSHSRLGEAVQYSLALPGKRFRPVLVMESCRACGGPYEQALAAALAVECVHTFSLIHDDLPAMDDDELRRGQPCCHRVFGEATAILAGDWLSTHAAEVLLDRYPPELGVALARVLTRGALGMVAGQAADIENEGQAGSEELVQFIHLHKTARLIEASCEMGAVCAQAAESRFGESDVSGTAVLADYGRHLGLAFQIVDDMLDSTASTEVLGKTAGKDADTAKQTYPAVFGMEASRRRARQEADAAVAALAPLGAGGDRLRELAQYVVSRDR